MIGLCGVKEFQRLCLAVLTRYQSVPDGQTDGRNCYINISLYLLIKHDKIVPSISRRAVVTAALGSTNIKKNELYKCFYVCLEFAVYVK